MPSARVIAHARPRWRPQFVRGVAGGVSVLLLVVAGIAVGFTFSASSPAAAALTSGVFGWGDNASGQATAA